MTQDFHVLVKDVVFGYRPSSPVFSGLSCGLARDKVTGLLGPSGSGKSSLLRLIAGIDVPWAGQVSKVDIGPVIGLVSQDPVVFEQYSRRQNARYRSERGSYRARFSEAHFRHIAEVLMLDDAVLNERKPLEPLSGGQRQRMILLRELSMLPDLLLLDEPCTGLDAEVRRDFLTLLRQVLCEYEIKCVYATHHFDELRLISDDVVYLHSSPCWPFAPPTHSILEFMAIPPTADAAYTLLGTLATTLWVRQEGDSFSISKKENASHALVFSEGSAKLGDSGFGVDRLFTSNAVTFLSLGGQTVIAERIIAPSGNQVIFDGPAFLFSADSTCGRIVMKTILRDDSWRISLSPL